MFNLKNLSAFSLLIFTLISTLIFSGIIRTVLDTELFISRIFSSLLHLTLYLYIIKKTNFLQQLTKIHPRGKELFIFFSLTLIPTLIFITINQFSLIELGTGDAYHHFKVIKRFEFRYPNAYHGFVSMYAFILGIKDLFNIDIFKAFIGVIYFNLFYTLSFLYLIFFKIGKLKVNVFNSLAFFLISYFILIPIYFEYIGQGGFVHALTISILPTFVFLYAFIEKPFLRVVLLLFFPIIIRYSYGLNLGDVLLVSAILITLELNKIYFLNNKLFKIITILAGILASLKAYLEITKIIKQGGSGTNINSLLIFIFLILFAFLYLKFRNRLNLNESEKRLFFISSLLVIITVLAELSFLSIEPSFSYYDYKYISNILILISYVSLIFYFKIYNSLYNKSLVLVLFVLFSITSMYGFHYNSYVKDKHKLFSFTEIEAIQEVLDKTNKKFAGFICHSWPRFRVVNHHFKRFNQTSFKYYSQSGRAKFKLKENQCVFWQNSKEDREKLARVMGGVGAYKSMDTFKKNAKEQKENLSFIEIKSKKLELSKIGYLCK